MKALIFDQQIESLKRRRKILDEQIEVLELQREAQRLRGRPEPAAPVIKETRE
jgi:hypothetical protein